MKKDYGYPSYELICQAASGEEIALIILHLHIVKYNL